jgi:hypothetical protein
MWIIVYERRYGREEEDERERRRNDVRMDGNRKSGEERRTKGGGGAKRDGAVTGIIGRSKTAGVRVRTSELRASIHRADEFGNGKSFTAREPFGG